MFYFYINPKVFNILVFGPKELIVDGIGSRSPQPRPVQLQSCLKTKKTFNLDSQYRPFVEQGSLQYQKETPHYY